MLPSLNEKLMLAGSLFGRKQTTAVSHSVSVPDSPGSGGSTDASYEYGTKDGWYWEKWPSGRACCKKRVSLTVTGWNSLGYIYESKEYVGKQSFPFEFSETPSFEAKNAGSNQSGAYIVGFELGTDATTMQSPCVYLLRGTAYSGTHDFYIDLCADGFVGTMEPDDDGDGTGVLGSAVLGKLILGKE